MKILLKSLLLFLLILGLSSTYNSTNAQQKGDNFGIGIMAGEPSGLTIKKWLTNKTAFDIGAAWSLSDRNEAIHLHTDFLIHNWFNDNPNLAFYYGIGGRAILDSEAKIGVRLPLGLNYVFENGPFDVFVEVAPILDIIPDTKFAGNGAFGFRFYF